jgi:uroporphyrinogen-III synthase
MPHRTAPNVVLLSSEATLKGIDRRLSAAGVRLVRLVALIPRGVNPAPWQGKLALLPPPDTVIVTSQAAVEAAVIPWRRTRRDGDEDVEFWAAGPGTAESLRAAGVRRVRRPTAIGAAGIRSAFHRRSPRTIVYFRSDTAGPALARELRASGHRVADIVAYRLEPGPKFDSRSRHELARATCLIATSPSSLSALRRNLDRRSFLRLRHSVRLVVLGERSRRAARGHGFRGVSVAPSTTAQRFTRFLLRELRDVKD